jgi:hypothetical protein
MEYGDIGVKFFISTIILGMALLAIVYIMVANQKDKNK